ncbi:MAG: hypothetical protein ACK5NT_11095 [Pyrinomonadaceae bacterium]
MPDRSFENPSWLGHWEDFDDWSKKSEDGFPGTGTRFIPSLFLPTNREEFDDAVGTIREILSENGGNNSCANFFGGAGSDALNNIVLRVNLQGDTETFGNSNNSNLGIRMNAVIQADDAILTLPSAKLSTSLSGDSVSVAATYGVTTASSVFINTNGPFLSASGAKIGGYVGGSLKSRVLQLLHELGHLTVIDSTKVTRSIKVGNETRKYVQYKYNLLLPVDGGNPTLSNQNTRRVLDACGSQINNISG